MLHSVHSRNLHQSEGCCARGRSVSSERPSRAAAFPGVLAEAIEAFSPLPCSRRPGAGCPNVERDDAAASAFPSGRLGWGG